MKKNNKGFFLVEAIVIIALVTIVMAYVYPNVAKLYENYENRVKYYDQTEDLYVLKVYDELIRTNENELEVIIDENKKLNKVNIENDKKIGDIDELYIAKYIESYGGENNINYNFKKYLTRLKKTSNDVYAYRLIGVFKDGSIIRYASIKVDEISAMQ